MALVKSRALRGLFVALGWLCVGIGFIGIVTPIIPTIDFVLIAAFLFSKSSVRFDMWLVNHRLFGPVVKDWRGGLGFTKRLKTVSIIGIVATFTVTLTTAITTTVGRIVMLALAVALITYILQLPTKPADVVEVEPV
jgi:hypothetical protein